MFSLHDLGLPNFTSHLFSICCRSPKALLPQLTPLYSQLRPLFAIAIASPDLSMRRVCSHCHPRLDPTSFSSSPASLFHSLTKTLAPPPKLKFVSSEVEDRGWSRRREESDGGERSSVGKEESAIRASHPWPEWLDLMECLLKRGYFRNGELKLGPKESNIVRTACLNFGRDQFDLLRFLSRKDMGVIVAFGCPSLDRKVINSGKRLRAHVGIDEGNVCSSCNLRGDCDRAFMKAGVDGGRTVDVMRIILTYGLDPIIASVENKPCLNKKVKESVRRLLKEIVEHSTGEENSSLLDTTEVVVEPVHPNLHDEGKIDVPMKQGDWLCHKNIKCLRCDSLCEEKIKLLQEENNHLPLKKGDWICNKCNFLNFAKNTRCLQCKEKPPKRHLNPGEWECDSCNYINFRRNMVCLKCNHRRPRASSLQPKHEDKDHHNNTKLTLVGHQFGCSDKSSMVSERKNRIRDSRTWRFAEDRIENHKCFNTSNDPSQFIDFPIAGGKTVLSEPQRREEYKSELLDQSETDDDLWPGDNLSTDDEEMAEWFGSGKNERQDSGKSDFDHIF